MRKIWIMIDDDDLTILIFLKFFGDEHSDHDGYE